MLIVYFNLTVRMFLFPRLTKHREVFLTHFYEALLYNVLYLSAKRWDEMEKQNERYIVYEYEVFKASG